MEAPSSPPGPLHAVRRAVPGEARQVVGLVAAFGVALFLLLAGLVWFDRTHPDPAPAPTDVMSNP